MPRLCDLIPAEDIRHTSGSLDVEIGRIVSDSRDVKPRDLFVCLPGYRSEGGETRADRHEFIPAALERGATALLVEREVAAVDGVTVVRVADCWSTLAVMASRYHGDPSHALLVVGVTGTSGKTSTTYFIDAVLRAAGHPTARLGTIEYRLDDDIRPAAQTTPEAPLLQSLLRQAVDLGCTAAVMEVSSHALELKRVHRVAFDVAVFTNLSHDHLNFHPDMDHYVRAKGRLFAGLKQGGKQATAVVNVDDPASAYIIGVNTGALLTYGMRPDAQVYARDIETTLRGTSFTATTPQGDVAVTLQHLGEYSVYNALAALAVGCALGIELGTVARGLAEAPAVPGRFELIAEGQDFGVAVDYAHKPDALARLLESARKLQPRRLITVFGCGGDRDRQKRPVMGRIAAERSDYVIVTSDNPRSEDPAAIVEQILGGVREIDADGRRHVAEVDRAAAIRMAIDVAVAGDMVIIAGKGHETYQLIAGRRLDFDDREHARDALRTRKF